MSHHSPIVRSITTAVLTAGIVLPSVISIPFTNSVEWILSSVCLAVFLISVPTGNGKTGRITRAAICMLLLIANLGYYVALRFGTTFTDEFFFHLEPTTLWVGIQVFPVLSFVCAAYLLLYLIASFLHTPPAVRSSIWALLAVVGILSNSPVVAASRFLYHRVADRPGRAMEVLRGRHTDDRTQFAATVPPDLILIYLESLEQKFLDEKLFGNLAPELSSLAAGGLSFTNMAQYPGTGWTIAGMVASQCGLPLLGAGLEDNQVLPTIHVPWNNYNCLAEILNHSGYQTLFLGGADLGFAGKGAFLKLNGYQVTMGFDQLKSRLPDPEYRTRWGLYDDTLLMCAWDQLEQRKVTPAPLMLTLLTLGTHGTQGQISDSCKAIAPEGDFSDAVRCTSYLVGNFVAKIRNDSRYRNAVVVLFSDHLAMRNTLSPKLLNSTERKLFFVILNGEHGVVSSPGSHFDVAPTILEAMGGRGYGEFPLGQSLLSHRQGFVSESRLQLEDFRGFSLSRIEGERRR